MNVFGLRFHHLGLAVSEPETAAVFLSALGYVAGAVGFEPLHQVNFAFYRHADMPDVEVLWPGDVKSPIDNLLQKNGALIYHVCYSADNVQKSLAAMKTAGLRVRPVGNPLPSALFDGAVVSFHLIVDVGLIELIHGNPLT